MITLWTGYCETVQTLLSWIGSVAGEKDKERNKTL